MFLTLVLDHQLMVLIPLVSFSCLMLHEMVGHEFRWQPTCWSRLTGISPFSAWLLARARSSGPTRRKRGTSRSSRRGGGTCGGTRGGSCEAGLRGASRRFELLGSSCTVFCLGETQGIKRPTRNLGSTLVWVFGLGLSKVDLRNWHTMDIGSVLRNAADLTLAWSSF